MKQRKISEKLRQMVIDDYNRRRAAKAGSVKSPAKVLAARRASLLAPKHLENVIRAYPDLAGDIQSYWMALGQEKVLARKALIEKLEAFANENVNGK